MVGLALGFRPGGGVAGVVLSLALVLVFAFSLSWVFTVLALIVRSPAAVQGVSMPVLFSFVFASNLFVDPDTMRAGCRRSSTSTRST